MGVVSTIPRLAAFGWWNGGEPEEEVASGVVGVWENACFRDAFQPVGWRKVQFLLFRYSFIQKHEK